VPWRRETRFVIRSDLILVDAELEGLRGTTRASLVFDTGAVMTTLVPRVAAQIGDWRSATRTTVRSATGQEHGYAIQVRNLRTLGFTIGPLQVNVFDLGYGIDGLLGQNFLKWFDYEVRFRERRMIFELAEPSELA